MLIMKDKTNLIFCHKLIKAFADSMIKVFVPLIILKSSGSLKLAILYSFPIIILQFLLTLEINIWLCLVIAMLAAFGQVLYSVPLNILFAFSDRKVNVAKFQIATNVGKLIFIVIGGLVIGSNIKNSILLLSIFGTILYLASIVPIVFGYKMLKVAYNHIAEHPPHYDKKSYCFFNVYHILFSIFQSVIDVIVPLYLFTKNITFESIAIAMALIELCKIGANMLAKFLVLKNKAIVSVFISVFLFVSSAIIILFANNEVLLYISSCLIGVSFPFLFVPTFSSFVKKLKNDNNRFDGMSNRDIYICLGKEIIYLPYFLFLSLVSQFIIGIGAAILILVVSGKFLVDYKNNKKLNV